LAARPQSGLVPPSLKVWAREGAFCPEVGCALPGSGPQKENWVAFEYPDFQGQQFILEKGDYPRWSAWSGSGGHHSDQLLSFRPVLCANHSDSRVTLFEGENFQGSKFELSDDYPSLPSMGWASKDVGSLKVSSGAWVAYQYPGYRGYQYVLERDRHSGEFRTYTEFGTQAHTGLLQSIRRVQH
uniref:Beta-crystallin A2 n=1 Tax=Ursus maritimus TaxID=29073 RepID=A0A452UYF7_URSMA